MKKYIVLSLIFLFFISGCKKGDEPRKEDVALSKKYAKYATSVYKNKNLKKWLATLSKAEPVELLTEEKGVKIGKDTIDISKVKLSDDSIGFIASDKMADKPIVFIDDTKAYIRNNTRSKVISIIPKGTIAFIISKKGEWIKIYAGKINSKWVTRHWVNIGYSTEEDLISEAKVYEEANAILANNPEKAIEMLNELGNSSSPFATLAREKMNELNIDIDSASYSDSDSESEEIINNEDAEDNIYLNEKRIVKCENGLRVRDLPSLLGEKIALIPNGDEVTILEEKNKKITISGKTGRWSKVNWNSKMGWVFGGYLIKSSDLK